jgi:hypothetical protein
MNDAGKPFAISGLRRERTMNTRLLSSVSSALALALSVAACSGGDGGLSPAPIAAPISSTPTPTSTPAPTPTPTPTGSYDTAEYRRSNAAVAANAIAAYNSGATGAGIKIGVVDSGINPALSEFAGKIDPASRDVAGTRALSDEDGHGTAVADVAAGLKDDLGIQGVAFNSTIVALRADDPGSCATPKTDTGGGCNFFDSAIAAGIDAARLAGARVINLSLGGSAPGTLLLNAISNATSAGIVIVISAGNDGEKPEGVNPDPFALVPAAAGSGNVIIAGSVGVSDGAGGTDASQLSIFSNKAGTGANYYLTALGYRDQAISTDGKYYYWSGTSFSAPTISGAVALLAQAFPNLTGKQIVDILFKSADDLGATGTDTVFGRGRLNIARAFQPIGTTSLAGSQIAVTGSNGSMPAAAGDATTTASYGAIVLDGYSRAYAVDLAKTLRVADQSRPLERALGGMTQAAGAAVGKFSVAMTVSLTPGREREVELARLGIGPGDARRARLIAGSAIARIDGKTAAAFGFAEGAKAMERRLSGAEAGAFLIARDSSADNGFSARRGASMALRRQVGPVGVTLSAENGRVWQDVATTATGSPYKLMAVAVDKRLGRTWLSGGISRLDEHQTLLGGRLGGALGGGGSTSLFLDLEARREFGNGWSASLASRRGWTSFGAGKFQSDAYAVDLAKTGLLSGNDRIGFRLAQPLRIATGGFATMLPTAYNYSTMQATNSLERFSLSPTGRELDAELSYGRSVTDSGWLGGNLFMRRQPGHIAAADNDLGGAIRFTLGF